MMNYVIAMLIIKKCLILQMANWRVTFWLYATFGAGNRALRSNDPCPKCGGEKTHKGRKPDCVFS